MRLKNYSAILAFAAGIVLLSTLKQQLRAEEIQVDKKNAHKMVMGPTVAGIVNSRPIMLTIDEAAVIFDQDRPYMDQDMKLMVPVKGLTESLDCAVHIYNRNKIVMEKNEKRMEAELWRNQGNQLQKESASASPVFVNKNDVFYVNLEAAALALEYDFSWDIKKNKAILADQNKEADSLPLRYDYRERERVPAIKNQGPFGTCWAFASLTALESSVMPNEHVELSPDHMNNRNSFAVRQNGGEYSMAMAYLLSWQGPVLEQEDPYGDMVSPEGLEAVMHVQEIQILESRDFQAIKEAVFKYGGVESALYTSLINSESQSVYYRKDTSAYCYTGKLKPNHDVVIIGWDDSYSRDNFNQRPEGDGAFICQNSWGESFGENGVFYVSYYDSNIGDQNVVYTGVEDAGNYDSIYQSDLCGWAGQLGYGAESAYFANVYEARSNEEIGAAGFYATGPDTDYELYVVKDFKDKSSLSQAKFIKSGKLKNAGYYTVGLPIPQEVAEGEKFAVMVKIRTPGSVHPIAVEYRADKSTKEADITDGEGYISLYGQAFERAEENQKSNLCLKVYTSDIE